MLSGIEDVTDISGKLSAAFQVIPLRLMVKIQRTGDVIKVHVTFSSFHI